MRLVTKSLTLLLAAALVPAPHHVIDFTVVPPTVSLGEALLSPLEESIAPLLTGDPVSYDHVGGWADWDGVMHTDCFYFEYLVSGDVISCTDGYVEEVTA